MSGQRLNIPRVTEDLTKCKTWSKESSAVSFANTLAIRLETII